MRVATFRDDIDVVAVNDPFVDAKYMVNNNQYLISVTMFLFLHDSRQVLVGKFINLDMCTIEFFYYAL